MEIVPARAKLNLGLAVVRRRDDGWHDIDTVMVPIDWHDLVGVTILATLGSQDRVRLTVSGATEDLGATTDNLAYRAATAVLPVLAAGVGLDVWIDKRLPIAAGLGGGSADAAAVLRAVAAVTARRGRPIDGSQLAAIAADLGSDVPGLLADRPLRARGRGELVSSIAAPALWATVSILAQAATPAAYAGLAAADFGGVERIERLRAALASGAVPAPDLLGSALEASACRANQQLAKRLTALRAAGPVAWHLTGSGGAVFSLHGEREAAVAAMATAVRLGAPAQVCRTVAGG